MGGLQQQLHAVGTAGADPGAAVLAGDALRIRTGGSCDSPWEHAAAREADDVGGAEGSAGVRPMQRRRQHQHCRTRQQRPQDVRANHLA